MARRLKDLIMTQSLSPQTAKEMHTLFSEGIALSGQLEHTLDNERKALEDQDRLQLKILSELKNNQLDRLSSNDVALTDLLQRTGIEKKSIGIDTLISLMPIKQQTKLVKLWHEHKLKLKACQNKNVINGRIIERSRSVVNHLLNIVNSGGAPQSSLYEANGKSNAQEGSRTIAKA